MAKRHLQHAGFLAADPGCLPHLAAVLYDPSFPLLRDTSTEDLETFLDVLLRRLPERPDLLALAELHILSEFLLMDPPRPERTRSWLAAKGIFGRFLGTPGSHTGPAGRFVAVPVLLAGDEKAVCRHFILGLVQKTGCAPLLPEWAVPLMDPEAREALKEAGSAAMGGAPLPEGMGLLAYPLLIPNQSIQITGRSLGLPLALGFLGLLRGRAPAQTVVATGTVREDGRVGEVEALEEKAACAAWEGVSPGRCQALIFPSSCRMPRLRGRMELLPVATLEEAWVFSSLYLKGRAKDLVVFGKMLDDPDAFVEGLAGTPHEWVSWAHKRGLLEKVLPRVLEDPERFRRLTGQLVSLTESGNLAAAECLGAFVPAESLPGLGKMCPAAALRWCTMKLALANHTGRVADGARWSAAGQGVMKERHPFEVHDLVEYYNHLFIDRHNRYCFDPCMPERVREILDLLERQHDEQRAIGSTLHRDLGRFCGSVMQNYAFCGPQYLDKAEEYSAKSRRAFGDGHAPELRPDWLRQLNYLSYAEMDAGLFARAEKTLLDYLEADGLESLWPKMDRLTKWQHGLLARFLAEAGDPGARERYLTWARIKKAEVLKREHPWQLWLNNLGRLAEALDDPGGAALFYEESLRWCFSQAFGPTVHIMALLPVSGLRRLGRTDPGGLSETARRIREGASALNPSYFNTVINGNFEGVLDGLGASPGTLFPFNYR